MGVKATTSFSTYVCAKGVTLLEVFIGLALGLLALELCCYWYSVSHQHWNKMQDALRDQRDMQTALLVLRQSAQGCGYRGMRGAVFHYPVYDGRYVGYRQANAHYSPYYRGFRAIGTVIHNAQDLPSNWHFLNGADTKKRLLSNSSVLTFHHLPVAHFKVVQSMKDPRDKITVDRAGQASLVSDEGKLKKNYRTALISDARGAEVFEIKSVDAVKRSELCRLTPTHALSRVYKPPSQVSVLQDVTYYVARSESDPKERYALVRRIWERDPQEIVLGVRDFQVEYGLWNEETQGWDYRSAQAMAKLSPPAWPRVSVLRLSIHHDHAEKPWVFELFLNHAA